MDYSSHKAASFDYMNSADLFKTNDFIYMPCHGSNSSSILHDLHGGHSDDYFNLNYDNAGEYNSDLLLFDSNDGSNVHHLNPIDQGFSVEMIKNERDFNLVFENLFDNNNGFGPAPLSHQSSGSDSSSMGMSCFARLNPVVNNMSSLLLSPSSMIEPHHVEELVASPAPFDSDKENSIRLPVHPVGARVDVGPMPAGPEVQFVAEKPADTRRTRVIPSRDQAGRFKNSSAGAVTVVVDANSSQQMVESTTIGPVGPVKPTPSRKSSKRSRSLVNNPNRRKRTKFTHEQIEILEKCFTRDTKYPDSSVIEHLACRTHLDFHTITIWFQNRRSKDKKMKKN